MKCPKCGDEMSEFPILNDDGRNGYTFVCEKCELEHLTRKYSKAKCCFCEGIEGALIRLHQGWCCVDCFKKYILKHTD